MPSAMKKLMYAPAIYQWDTDKPPVPEMFHYKWQRELWMYFEGKEELRVLWKVGKHSHCEDPVRHWKARNITYSAMPMAQALDNVDGVFVDTVGSSVIWDASRAGVLVLCCYFWHGPERVVVPVEGLHLHHCRTAGEAYGWLDLFVSGGLRVNLLHPRRSDWLGTLRRDYERIQD